MVRIAALSDIHGNLPALVEVRKVVDAARPDYVAICGDFAMNGPDPAGAVDVARELERAGAFVIAGNTDVAVTDGDFTAAFPWFAEGVPDTYRAAAAWARDQLGDERIDWLRRLPWERRLQVGEQMVLFCHGSPGSLTDGLAAELDPTVTIERLSRTDARVVVCGHTHVPEVRDLGWRMIVNDGSAGYIFDGDPTASWALLKIEGDTIEAEIKRVAYDVMAAANAVSERGLPGDVYRAATIRTGKLVR
jgi:putative phosphoesterase